jgi:poly(A) polymerase
MDMRDAARKVLETLREAGFEAFLVGGCVRDLVLEKSPKDFDITTNATPEQVRPLFEHTIPVGAKFGVIVVMVHGQQIEVATYRADGAYSDGRRPDTVEYSNSVREDVVRRDFTMNGLLIATAADAEGRINAPLDAGFHLGWVDTDSEEDLNTVVDYVEGLSDIRKQVVRCIGDPNKRFEEDQLRMLRAVRFVGQLGFEIEAGTFAAIQQSVGSITSVSRERIAEELKKLTTGKFAAKGVAALVATGLFRRIFPTRFVEATNVALLLERFNLCAASNATEGLAMLLADCRDRDAVAETLDSFKLSREESDTIRDATYFRVLVGTLGQLEEGAVRLFARTLPLLGVTLFEQDLGMGLYNVGVEAGMANALRLRSLTREDLYPAPMVTGADLIAMGFKPSPLFTKVLTAVEFKQLNSDFESREAALEFAKCFCYGAESERR